MSATDLRLQCRPTGFRPSHAWASAPRSPGGSTRLMPAPRRWAWSGTNTGCLTAYTPAVDIDITDPEAATLAEEVAKELFGDRGKIPVRFGRLPKRTLPFRTATPFPKMSASFEAPNGTLHKIEILGDGQQFICFGIHPDTGEPFTWHGGTPLDTPREELAEVTEEDMQAYLELVSERLAEECGFKRVFTNGHGAELDAGPVDVDERLQLHALRRRRRQCHPPHPAARHGVAVAQRAQFRRDHPHRPRRHQAGRRRRPSRPELGLGRRGADDRAHVRKLHQQEPGLSCCLPEELREPFEQKHDQGREPYLVYRRDRGWQVAAAKGMGDRRFGRLSKAARRRGPAQAAVRQRRHAAHRAAPTCLRADRPGDLAATRVALRQTLSASHGQRDREPGGSGKTSLVMVEAVAMATAGTS